MIPRGERSHVTTQQLAGVRDGLELDYCGIVTPRQPLETAMSVMFVSLEDEINVQIIVRPNIKQAQCKKLLGAPSCWSCEGPWQWPEDARKRIWVEDLTTLLGS